MLFPAMLPCPSMAICVIRVTQKSLYPQGPPPSPLFINAGTYLVRPDHQVTSLSFSAYGLKAALASFLLPYNIIQHGECCPPMLTCPAVTGILSAIVAVVNGLLFSFLEGRQQKLELGGSGMAMAGKSQAGRMSNSCGT